LHLIEDTVFQRLVLITPLPHSTEARKDIPVAHGAASSGSDVLVTGDREMNIPDNIEAEGRWPHDHLFIDQDGIPTQPLRSGGAGRI
jgi:hypothetical protein